MDIMGITSKRGGKREGAGRKIGSNAYKSSDAYKSKIAVKEEEREVPFDSNKSLDIRRGIWVNIETWKCKCINTDNTPTQNLKKNTTSSCSRCNTFRPKKRLEYEIYSINEEKHSTRNTVPLWLNECTPVPDDGFSLYDNRYGTRVNPNRWKCRCNTRNLKRITTLSCPQCKAVRPKQRLNSIVR